MKIHSYSVYIVASKSGVIYIGMTNNLERRVYQHKNDSTDSFSKKYRCHRLVFFESFDEVLKAIDREKQLKRWNRAKKGLPDRAPKSDVGRLSSRVVHQAHVSTRQAGPSTPQLICYRGSTDSVGMTELFKLPPSRAERSNHQTLSSRP